MNAVDIYRKNMLKTEERKCSFVNKNKINNRKETNE